MLMGAIVVLMQKIIRRLRILGTFFLVVAAWLSVSYIDKVIILGCTFDYYCTVISSCVTSV